MNQDSEKVIHNITFSNDLLEKFKLKENKTYTLSIKFIFKNSQAIVVDDYFVEENVEEIKNQTKKFDISKLMPKKDEYKEFCLNNEVLSLEKVKDDVKYFEKIDIEDVIKPEEVVLKQEPFINESKNTNIKNFEKKIENSQEKNSKNDEEKLIIIEPFESKKLKVKALKKDKPKAKEEKVSENQNFNEKISENPNLNEKISENPNLNEKSSDIQNLNEKVCENQKLKEKISETQNLKEKSSENQKLKENISENQNFNEKVSKNQNLQKENTKINIENLKLPFENFNVANKAFKNRLLLKKESNLKPESTEPKVVLIPKDESPFKIDHKTSPKGKSVFVESEIIKISEMKKDQYSIIKGVVTDYLDFKKSQGSDYLCTITLCDDIPIRIRHFCSKPEINFQIIPGDVLIINKVKQISPYSVTYKNSKFILKYNCLFSSLVCNESLVLKKSFFQNNTYLKQIFQLQHNTKGDFIGLVVDVFINSDNSKELLITDFTTSSLVNEKREIKGIKNTKLVFLIFKTNKSIGINVNDVIYFKNLRFIIEGEIIKAYFYADSIFKRIDRKDIISYFNEQLIPNLSINLPTPKLINPTNSDVIYRITSRIKELKRINTTLFCINCKSEICTAKDLHSFTSVNSYKVKLTDYKINSWFMTTISEIEMYDRGELLEFYIAKLAYKTLKVEHILAIKLGKEENEII